MVSIPSNAEAYCKAMYGDYMALPPKEKQVPHHDIAYLDLNTPCKVYDDAHKDEFTKKYK